MSIKQMIINLAEKKIDNARKRKRERLKRKGKDITFTIWWWIAKNITDRKELDYICVKLARYYSDKIDVFVKTKITDIVILNNTVFIYLVRPGMMIGKMGKSIDELTDTVNKNLHGVKESDYRISLIEDNSSWQYKFFRNIAIMNEY